MIESLSAEQASACVDQLCALLQDTVTAGASIGFLPPLDANDARVYWETVIQAVRLGNRLLLIARDDEGRTVGTVQLDLAQMPNGSHRAEVMKLLVASRSRRQGFGRALMLAIEQAAWQAGRSLLVLDTRTGDSAEQLYLTLGYQRAGIVPNYARGADGDLHDTVIFYKHMNPLE